MKRIVKVLGFLSILIFFNGCSGGYYSYSSYPNSYPGGYYSYPNYGPYWGPNRVYPYSTYPGRYYSPAQVAPQPRTAPSAPMNHGMGAPGGAGRRR